MRLAVVPGPPRWCWYAGSGWPELGPEPNLSDAVTHLGSGSRGIGPT